MNTLAIINPNNAIATRTYKNSETRTYGGALKFTAFCESQGLDNSNSTHADRVLRHSKHCNEVNSNGQAVQSLAQKEGLVFDKVSVNTDSNGIRRMTMSYTKIVVPKEKLSRKAKLANRVSSSSAEAQARIEAILAEEEAKTITVS
jgi:hypothetical protein